MQEAAHTHKKKRSSTKKMTKISRIPSLLASATAKGPCKHNRLYLCVGGRICVLVTGMLFRYTQGSGRTLGYC